MVGKPYYYKEQQCGLPVLTQERDDAKVFEYEEYAKIVAELLTLYTKANIHLSDSVFAVEPDFENARYAFVIKEIE